MATNDFQSRASREGNIAQDEALAILETAGFTIVHRNYRYHTLGLTVNAVVRDRNGGRWLVDTSGAYTSDRTGLKRTDTVFKTLGRASILAINREEPILLLTTDLPHLGSGGDLALRATDGQTFFDVIQIDLQADFDRLQDYAENGVRTDPIPGFWPVP